MAGPKPLVIATPRDEAGRQKPTSRLGVGVPKEVRYVLLCRHASHVGGALKPDEKTKRYPTQDVTDRLREELLFGKELDLKRLLYAPTPEARRTAWLLWKELSAAAPQQPPEPTPTDKLLEVARGTVYQQGGVLIDPSPHPPAAFAGSHGPDTGKTDVIPYLSGEGTFTISPPDWVKDKDNYIKGPVRYQECDDLSPALPRTFTTAEKGENAITKVLDELSDKEGVLVVGHMPQLSWLGYRLTRGFSARRWKPWERAALPLANGEVACLAVTKRRSRWSGHLRWTITPTDDEALKSLYEKIKGKMETAKQLAAVITLVLSVLLGVLLDPNKWTGLGKVKTGFPAPFDSAQVAAQAAFGLLLAAVALYLMTMYAYDRLLMPTRFWAELPPRRSGRTRGGSWLPRRPPSSSAWVVYRNMMRTWYTLFTLATALAGAALIVLGAALLQLRLWDLVWAVPAVFALVVIRWVFRPVLGSED